jgi:hypothetical protein
MQQRRCPSCHACLPVGHGVKFDDQNNVLCARCGKPLVAATAAAEAKIVDKATTTTTSPANVGYYGTQLGPGRAAAASRSHVDRTPPWTEGVDGEGWEGWAAQQKSLQPTAHHMDCFY